MYDVILARLKMATESPKEPDVGSVFRQICDFNIAKAREIVFVFGPVIVDQLDLTTASRQLAGCIDCLPLRAAAGHQVQHDSDFHFVAGQA